LRDDIRGIRVAEGTVPPEWIDYNDHMNVAYYVLAFDLAIDALWARLGITDDYIRETRGSTFAVETHVSYQRELKQGDRYLVTMELLAYDEKRIHQFQRMYHAGEGYLAATAEWMSLHVDLTRRKVTEWPAPVLDELAVIAAEQGAAEPPEELCGRMRVRTPIFTLYQEDESP
jgi:acyl-CoA thioester hydrolase